MRSCERKEIEAIQCWHWTLTRVCSVTRMDKCSRVTESVSIGNCKISRLLFADDLVLLASTESDLHCELNVFARACDTAGMKISTSKTEVLHLSRKPDKCSLQVSRVSLKQVEKFKYLGVAFTSDGMSRGRTGYPNGHSKCSNAGFASFSCHETRIAEKS